MQTHTCGNHSVENFAEECSISVFGTFQTMETTRRLQQPICSCHLLPFGKPFVHLFLSRAETLSIAGHWKTCEDGKETEPSCTSKGHSCTSSLTYTCTACLLVRRQDPVRCPRQALRSVPCSEVCRFTQPLQLGRFLFASKPSSECKAAGKSCSQKMHPHLEGVRKLPGSISTRDCIATSGPSADATSASDTEHGRNHQA